MSRLTSRRQTLGVIGTCKRDLFSSTMNNVSDSSDSEDEHSYQVTSLVNCGVNKEKLRQNKPVLLSARLMTLDNDSDMLKWEARQDEEITNSLIHEVCIKYGDKRCCIPAGTRR